MPKKTARRIIDTKRDTGTTIITGVTVSGSPGSGASAAMAGDGLTYSSGVLNVGAGTLLTVGADSVGITAGSTYQYIGTGSGTAAAWQNLSGLAGAGLTHSAGVLAVGAGNGITVNADDVALTTPGTLTVSTTNSATGSHTHAITSSSNPGANARLLASTASGGLTLQSLAVQGSVDVTNGGDLTVAGSGSYAGSNVLFVDSSGGNVGIMGAPDPQFALDIVGPCRATWFVGPHAIQLKDVLLLSHFDGRQPFETNFSGEPNGHMGQVATATYVIYRQGKFGTKAAQIANAKTNLITNPSFETGTSGWATTGGATTAQTAAHAVVGTYAMNVNRPGSTTAGVIFTVSSSVAATYYGSVWVRATSSGDVGKNVSIFLRFAYTDATSTDTTRTDHALTSEWVRISSGGATNGAKTLSSVAVHVRDMTSGGTAHAWLMDAAQVETSALTPYVDGTLGSGHSWSGTAHASTSARSAASLTYPTDGNINEEIGTVMAWVKLPTVSGTYDILRIAGSSAGNILLYVTAGQVQAYWGTGAVSAGGTISANTWHHVAMTYSGGTLTTYVDGVQAATGSSSGFSGMPATMSIGTSNILNGWIDDLCITESAMEADAIRAVYESDAPVFAESSRFSFRATPQGLVWADDEGLWMRNASGSAVFGAYGGASTKSWGGLTLSPSDVVIGDSSRGSYAWWDDSAGAFAIGKGGTDRITLSSAGVLSIKDSGGNAVFTFDASAGAEFTKPLTIGTSGGIYQGSGTFASPTTGLKIWNDSGVGRLAGYNIGAQQWTIGTDGKFYSADSDGNSLRIDSSAVRLRMTSGSEAFPSLVWCRPLDTSDIFTDYHGNLFSTYNTSTKVARMYLRSYVNTDTNSSYEARTIVEAMGKVSGTTSGASMEVVRNRTQYYINMNAYQVNFSGYLQCGIFSAPSGSPPSGYLYVWFASSGSNYTLNVKNSSGTTKSVTLS